MHSDSKGTSVSTKKTKRSPNKSKKSLFLQRLKRDRVLILISLPVVIHMFIFRYIPMYGNLIAFQNYNPFDGIWGSDWVGFDHFRDFFNSIYFGRLMRNTIVLSVLGIVWGFPLPIVFALMVNDLKDGFFKRSVQTVSYIPYFISTVVVCGMITNFLSPSTGIVNKIIVSFGGQPIHFLMEPKWFRTIFIASGVWQGFGWSSIIYLAGLSGTDPQLYDAAKVDGANKLQRAWHISLPSIKNTIVILLILNIGSIMNVGFEKVMLLSNEITWPVADVISYYVYRRGLVKQDFSYGAAVGLFNNIVNLFLLVIANKLAKRYSDSSLW